MLICIQFILTQYYYILMQQFFFYLHFKYLIIIKNIYLFFLKLVRKLKLLKLTIPHKIHLIITFYLITFYKLYSS